MKRAAGLEAPYMSPKKIASAAMNATVNSVRAVKRQNGGCSKTRLLSYDPSAMTHRNYLAFTGRKPNSLQLRRHSRTLAHAAAVAPD